jgi:hypothetical protein
VYTLYTTKHSVGLTSKFGYEIIYYAYFDFSGTFGLVSHHILLHKLCAHGLSDGYITSCNRRLFLLLKLPSVSQKYPFQTLYFFNIFVSDLCNTIKYSKYLLIADNFETFRAVNSADVCTFLHSGIESMQGWCTAYFVN